MNLGCMDRFLLQADCLRIYISISFFRNPSMCEKESGREDGKRRKEGGKKRRKEGRKITQLNERMAINEFQTRKVLGASKTHPIYLVSPGHKRVLEVQSAAGTWRVGTG